MARRAANGVKGLDIDVYHEFMQSPAGRGPRGLGRAGLRRPAGDRVRLIGQFCRVISVEHGQYGCHVAHRHFCRAHRLDGHLSDADEQPCLLAEYRVRLAERDRLADRGRHLHR